VDLAVPPQNLFSSIPPFLKIKLGKIELYNLTLLGRSII
jgi:hypothetical protein